MMKLLLDFLAAVGSLFYVVGGYFLGKWQSDESQITLYREIKEVTIHTMKMETAQARTYEAFKKSFAGSGVQLPPLPFGDYGEFYKREEEKLKRDLNGMKRTAQCSKLRGIACVAVGTVLFVARLMI